MFVIDVISRVIHVATAITLIGGSTFIFFVLMPAWSGLAENTRQQLMTAVQGRWKRFVHGGIALFLLSGFYNYFRAMPSHEGDGLYHALVGTKILIALVVFFLASALVGRGKATERFRRGRHFWLGTMLVLAAIIVAISGYVKIRGGGVEAAVFETAGFETVASQTFASVLELPPAKDF